MTATFGIVDVLKIFGFDERAKSKLVRHQDKRYDVMTLVRDGWFEIYQSLQARPVYNNCDQIVSFVGDGSSRARFVGVYNVLAHGPASKSLVPASCPYKEWETAKYHYKLQKSTAYSDLEHRIVVDWPAERAWHQRLKNRPIIEVFPKGRILEPFRDYLDFSLSYDQLVQLTESADAHRDWRTSLEAVAGIYLVLAETTGHQYVGSAYGLGGIWNRWCKYAKTRHAGNSKLRPLVDKDSKYPRAFRFSILHVLPKSTTKEEIIRYESLYKTKLGSRATGLNLN